MASYSGRNAVSSFLMISHMMIAYDGCNQRWLYALDKVCSERPSLCFGKVGDCPDDSSTVSVPLMRVCPCPISGAVCFFTSANILIEGICCSSIIEVRSRV